jgi:1-acyl-sn-glycerol-3-phosphate acyltransferase
MTTYEEELKKFSNIIHNLGNFALLGKKIAIKGSSHFVREGGNIIIGNHIGTYKDIATLFKVVPRPIFFTSNKELFNRDDFTRLSHKHIRRHMGRIGHFVIFMLNPILSLLINYISTNISKIGTIPVNLYGKKSEAIKRCQDYIKNDRAIIALQGHGRIAPNDPFPYAASFRWGAAIIAYNLYKEDKIKVPVTPVAMFGTHYPLFIPYTIQVRVGKPMYITDHMADGKRESVNRFKDALEKKVKDMIKEILEEGKKSGGRNRRHKSR